MKIPTDKTNLCKNCKKLVAKYKPWNEQKVPQLAEVAVRECKKCKMEHMIYKDMIQTMEKI